MHDANHKASEALYRSSKWLADGNAAKERGDKERAERCYQKSQFWLDRLNKIEGRN